MSNETELSVSQARDHFSDAVNRAAFGGEITFVTRGRGRHRAAAIVRAVDALGAVLAWAELHQEELRENWRLARAGETLREIEPLR